MEFSGLKGLIHRHLWRHLPKSWRRAALFRSAAMLAPRPSPEPLAAFPVIVVGTLCTTSGLGESARLCYQALKDAGLPVYGVDLTTALMQTLDLPDFAFEDGSGIEGPGTIILHVNGPLVPMAMLALGRRFVKHKRIVCYWHWELPVMPADWRYGVPFVHEIWAPTGFVADAVKTIARGRPVRCAIHPAALRRPTVAAHPPADPDRPFTVLTIFNVASNFARKNPLGTIAAFRRAFGDDPGVRLVVKVSGSDVFPDAVAWLREAAGAAANIELIDETLSVAALDALYARSDAVISLHRAEGFGLTIAEAMIRGLPSVATDWSGSIDFLDAETGIPVPYRLVPVEDPQGTYDKYDARWADADIDAAADALQRLRNDPQLAHRLGRQAAAHAARILGPEAYVATVRQHLDL